MSSTNSSCQQDTEEVPREDAYDDFSFVRRARGASDAILKKSKKPAVDLKSNDAATPTVETKAIEEEKVDMGPPAKRLKYHDNKTITVLVGADQTTFTIHRGPICEVSAYFKALFDDRSKDDRFKESSENAVPLEDHTPGTFDQFLGFAYAKSLDGAPFIPLSDEQKCMAYGRLYVLADYLGADGLKTVILRILFDQFKSARRYNQSAGITAQFVDYVYTNTIRNCGLRKLIVAQHIWGSDNESFRKTDALDELDTFLGALDADFLAELAAESLKRVWDEKTRNPFKGTYTAFYIADKHLI